MLYDLEGLIAGLLVLISSTGEQGCAVVELLGAIRQRLLVQGNSDSTSNNGNQGKEDGGTSNLRGTATVWSWLVQRPDVSLGPDRKYNHLSLDEILALSSNTEGITQADLSPSLIKAPPEDEEWENSPLQGINPPQDMRAFASEETMWESLTGHGVDYKRVPRSEWLLILGIASKKTEGILQGDLGRLVDQDKRSVPKRTDALMKKGYVTKRTTLARGTKTSKIWLSQFAPVLAKEGDGIDEQTTAGMNLSQEFLTANLDPVPWHHRWTGEFVDYIALATTILAVAKAWGTIRLHDMKVKLGILGMKWQMKVLSKSCRFLNERGNIQYVAAILHGRVFKDCVKFVRSMDSHDWTLYLATGKRDKMSRILGSTDPLDSADHAGQLNASPSIFASHPRWSFDEPLLPFVARTVRSFGEPGLTNPDIYSLTLGPSFSRYVSTLTQSIATSRVQPPHLRHLQLRSEHVRTGKVASFRFFMQPDTAAETRPGSAGDPDSASTPYGFASPASKYGELDGISTLASLCGMKFPRGKRRGRPRGGGVGSGISRQQPQQEQVPEVLDHGVGITGTSSPSSLNVTKVSVKALQRAPESTPDDKESTQQPTDSKALVPDAGAGDLERPGTAESQQEPMPVGENNTLEAGDITMVDAVSESGTRGSDPETKDTTMDEQNLAQETETNRLTPGDGPAEDLDETTEMGNGSPAARGRGRGRGRPPLNGRSAGRDPGRGRGRVRGRGQGRGRGRGRGGTARGDAAGAAPKPFVCENCGGSWKNDLGLKYHLEKSKTSCNPSYDPTAVPTKPPRVSRLESTLAPAVNYPGEPDDQSEITPSGKYQDESDVEVAHSLSSDRLSRLEMMAPRRREKAGELPRETKHVRGNYSQKVSGPRRLQPSKTDNTTVFSTPKTGQGVLLSSDTVQTRQVADIAQRPTHELPISPPPVYTEIPRESRAVSEPKAAEPVGGEVDDDLIIDPALKAEPEVEFEQIRKDNLVPEQVQPSFQDQGLMDHRSSKIITKVERNRRVGQLVYKLLAEHNGVFPGGEALWRTLRLSWDKEYSPERPPTTKEFRSALRSMVSKKDVAEHLHAFRGANGIFSKCQLITRPDMDAFSSESLQLIDKIKEAHPKLYIPGQAASEERRVPAEGDEPVFITQGSQGRRHLANEISTLDAPVYAAQVAAKRELADAEDEHRQRKRQQRHATTKPRKKGQIRFASGARDSTYGELPHTVVPLVGSQRDRPLQFLDPNTYMEEEPPGYSPQELSRTRKSVWDTPKRKSRRYKAGRVASLIPSAGIVPPISITGSGFGTWPHLEPRFFEERASSFAVQGWLPTSQWFAWAGITQEIDKKTAARASRNWSKIPAGDLPYKQFMDRLRACIDVETSWGQGFVCAAPGAAGPHNIFVEFTGTAIDGAEEPDEISWPPDGQLISGNMNTLMSDSETAESSWSESELDAAAAPLFTGPRRRPGRRGKKRRRQQEPRKRVPLSSRRLTALPDNALQDTAEVPHEVSNQTDKINNPDEVLAALIAVRALLGGIEKSVDWGLLVQLFPDISLDDLRKFWFTVRKCRNAYVEKFTHDFHEKFLAACEKEEIPLINYDNILEYDWEYLIWWTMEIPSQDGVQIPPTRDELDRKFSLEDIKTADDDWREKFFHVQSSTYGRLDAVTAEPGAIIAARESAGFDEPPPAPTEVQVARSWIKSLCFTGETQYSPGEIREQLLTLGEEELQSTKVASLLRRAIDELTVQKVIYKSKRPALGGRPWRLTEVYTSTLAKMSQRAKYEEAAAFKAELDATFRKGETLQIPYNVDDGSLMALINMNAHGRIKVFADGVPYIPFGPEPGNYETRKLPRSYYQFILGVVPTETYLYNEDIETLQAVAQELPPLRGAHRELPQWVDFFGECDSTRWRDILGAFCFAYSTRGQMSIEGICSALRPILEDFEARMICDWGKRTGVLVDSPIGKGLTVGEWWWLAVT